MTTQAGTVQSAALVTMAGDPSLPVTMELQILDPDQDRAPTSVNVVLTGGEPNEEIVFTIGADEVWRETTDSGGGLFMTSVAIPGTREVLGILVTGYVAGTYTLTATGTRVASADFTLARDASPYPAVQSADVDPVAVIGRGNRWALQDAKPGGLGSWIMDPSPTSMSEPELAKVLDVEHSTHPIDGQYHITVTDNGAKAWTWGGYCPDQDFYDNLAAFAAINRRFYVIDHRGRAWKTTIVRVELTARKRQVNDDGSWNDWAHDYTVTATVYDVDWLEPV